MDPQNSLLCLPAEHPPLVVVVMGVSGAGKTTVGQQLAVALGWRFLEGDQFHPAANVVKMAAGQPLTDDDRDPWLGALGAEIQRSLAKGQSLVVACSALKAAYRDRLRATEGAILWFVYLKVPVAVLRQRLHTRQHPFMPESLLDSQLATLEEPTEGIVAAHPVAIADLVRSLHSRALHG